MVCAFVDVHRLRLWPIVSADCWMSSLDVFALATCLLSNHVFFVLVVYSLIYYVVLCVLLH